MCLDRKSTLVLNTYFSCARSGTQVKLRARKIGRLERNLSTPNGIWFNSCFSYSKRRLSLWEKDQISKSTKLAIIQQLKIQGYFFRFCKAKQLFPLIRFDWFSPLLVSSLCLSDVDLKQSTVNFMLSIKCLSHKLPTKRAKKTR